MNEFPNEEQAEQFAEDDNRTLPPNERWSGGPLQPRDKEESGMRDNAPPYTPRDKGEPLKEDELGPNLMNGDADD